MLSPRYLAGLSEELVEIYSQLETDILCDMARRLSRVGKITEMTEYQARTLVEAGLLKQNISRVLKNYDRRILEELTAIFSEAMIKSIRADNRIFKEDMGRTLSDSQAQVMLASIKKVHSDLSRLTLTTAETGNAQFIRLSNRSYMNVASGAFNFNSAIKQAVDELAKEGLHTRVTYSNQGKKPVTRSIEAAVRMNVLTGVNQTAAAVSLTNCDELECDLVEVTAHTGSRPSHEAWQGKIYSISGKSNKYPPFSVCGYGEADGICGVNCRHSFYPYFEGQEKHYTQDDLDELSTESVTYNGKEMTRYEGEQQLRHIERNIRFYKKKAAIENAANLDNSKSRIKIGEWQARARNFTKETGIMRDTQRERIGMPDGNPQPKGLPPAIQGYADNLELAKDMKRLDNARNKVIAQTKQGKPMNFRQADGGSPNPNYKKGGGYAKNCQTCVVAYELRRRGFNVEALSNYKGSMSEVLSYNTSLAWVDRNSGKPPAYIIPGKRTVKQAFEYLKTDLEKEHRYTIEFSWKNKTFGHIIHLWKNKDNILSLYDPQNGINTRGNDDVMRYLEKVRPSTIKLLDVQNCDINMNVVNKILQGARK